MDIQTKFYGSVSFQENELINFPEGLPGFEDCHRFLLLQPEGSVLDACNQWIIRLWPS